MSSDDDAEKSSQAHHERKVAWSGDLFFKLLTLVLASGVIITIILMVIELLTGSLAVLERFGVGFVTGVNWNPVAGREAFGILPYILGTLVTSALALLIGVPISLGIAIFLSEMAPNAVRTPLSFLIELLAAVPSVVYGLWGIFILRFWVKDYIETPLSTYLGFIPGLQGTPFGLDILTAGIILAIMIIPTVSAVSREIMNAVPDSQREAAYSIGATRWETIRIGVLSYARSGIFGAAILGLGRAVGETMAVTMVIGNTVGPAALPTSLLKGGQTMASLIANEFNEADPTSLHPSALIGVGLVLFLFALAINIFAQFLVWRVLKVRGGAVE
ncbi:MAG: phosphate ABC transporter permease subunit PstC [Thaumarchaeota archaeon]|nr:phosphate ABC transporter permease subunit PstC [Nitrososphaerota archaeon]MCL5318337.1 phosphate ABC transporter permease subunit PstC [Nitrososphaerota archaeon]